MKSIFHKYYCGCIGVPTDSQNGLIVKACDDDSGEYFMGMRDMTDKKSEPMKWDEQDELIHNMSHMLARGHGVTDFAYLIDRIMDRKGSNEQVVTDAQRKNAFLRSKVEELEVSLKIVTRQRGELRGELAKYKGGE